MDNAFDFFVKHKWWFIGGIVLIGLYLIFSKSSSTSVPATASNGPDDSQVASAAAVQVASQQAQAAITSATLSSSALNAQTAAAVTINSQNVGGAETINSQNVGGAETIDQQDNAAALAGLENTNATALGLNETTNSAQLAELQNQDFTSLQIAQSAATIQNNAIAAQQQVADLSYQTQQNNAELAASVINSGVLNKGGEGGTNQLAAFTAALNPNAAASVTASASGVGVAQSNGSASVLNTITKTLGSVASGVLGNLGGGSSSSSSTSKSVPSGTATGQGLLP